MRKEDLKNWTRDMLKDRIMELEKIVEQWKCDNGKMLQIMKKTQNENNELRKRLGKLESDICGTSPYILSEFHSFEGESWIKALTYDDVLLRLKKANERITDLEQDRFNKSTEELKQVEKLQSENKSLKDENKALKQRIKDLEDIGNNYEPQFAPDDDISAFNYECVKQWTTEMGCKRKIQELQGQHQQDCFKINQLNVTIDTLVDKYSMLRKTAGMD